MRSPSMWSDVIFPLFTSTTLLWVSSDGEAPSTDLRRMQVTAREWQESNSRYNDL